jgi:peptidoglycan hydrolase-like protein with peptidoglycan-binding domain
MKKIIIALILVGVLSVPVATRAVSSTSSVQDLIATLQAQIAALNVQIAQLRAQAEALKQAQSAVKETTKEVAGTLKLLKHLRVGMSGDDVKTLQELLATDHDIYPEGLITGHFGKLTEKAVRKLQKKLCIDQVGQVGPQTMRRINELLEEGAGNSGHVPAGLLTAPGIQKKLCATTSPDIVAPVISNLISTSTTATTTEIRWTTDEKANGKVWYGALTPLTVTTSTASVSSSDYDLEHNIKLSDLTASTTYYYLVSSTDKSGNATTSTEKSFMTLGQ